MQLDLSWNAIETGGTQSLAGVLGRCPALAHLDLSENRIGAAGAESLAGVLVQCRTLAHLNRRGNEIYAALGDGEAESFPGVLAQCAQRWLTLISAAIGFAMLGQSVLQECWGSAQRRLTSVSVPSAGSPRSQWHCDRQWSFAGVLVQCAALAYLNLCQNSIGAAGAESLAGVLAQCRALVHLNLSRK